MTDAAPRTRSTRRALLTTAAWTVPTAAVAVSAPAMAASPCSSRKTGTVAFTPTGANYTRLSSASGSATVPLQTGDAPVRLTLSSTFANSGATVYSAATSGTRNNFGVTADGLDLLQANTGTNGSSRLGQLLTIDFDRPVTNVRFRLTGFTQNAVAGNTFRDAVWASTVPTTQTKNTTTGLTVTGSGTQSSSWLAPNGSNSPEARYVDLTYSGPISSLSFRYFNSAEAATSGQAISIAT